MKKIILIPLMILLLSIVAAAIPAKYDFHVDRIRMNDVVQAGDTLAIKLNVENQGTTNYENVRLTATIPELGLKAVAGKHDLREGREVSKYLLFEIPEYVAPGWYTVRITISNDKFMRNVHRDFAVI